jgi:ornithine cyclodeaminase/alanine dehydrogenase-like protein (mu-crystallin family)
MNVCKNEKEVCHSFIRSVSFSFDVTTMFASSTVRLLTRTPAAFAPTARRGLAKSAFPAPRLFDYETVTANLTVADAIDSVEAAFGALAKGKVDVPMPMHIGIEETPSAGPGDCHIKGGYISGTKTFTVKLACVSFYKNMEKGLPPGSGVFIVVDAVTGAPLAILQENRFMTDLRTGAAGAVAIKYTTLPDQDVRVGFIGCGAIARTMARAAKAIKPNFKGFAFGLAGSEEFCADMKAELGVDFEVVASAKELCAKTNVIFTQTPGSQTVVELDWLKPGTTIIASGSDQPTKQEIPNDVLKASKYISDLTKQTSKVGELRGALQAGVMKESDVYCELGELVNGKAGRVGDELIVVDLTGTGAQDAAIGQVAWDKLSAL